MDARRDPQDQRRSERPLQIGIPSGVQFNEVRRAFDLDYTKLWSILLGMKVKTSVTLSPETIEAIDEIAGARSNRSRLIEQAVVEFVASHRRRQREAKDLEILNRSAERLNRETEDVLRYQVEP